MGAPRRLVVNADDLGMTPAVNEGIFGAHADGVVTSASLMVRQGSAEAAAASLDGATHLAVGLHLDLGGWRYLEGEPQPADLRWDADDPAAVERECRAQLERFRALTGRDPTHVDSHKHLHEREPLASIARRLAAELDVPLRGVTIRYEGRFYGRDGDGAFDPARIATAGLIALIESLPAGWTEIGCHPASGPVPSSYDAERRIELRTLRDPTIRAAIATAGIELRSFDEIGFKLPEQT